MVTDSEIAVSTIKHMAVMEKAAFAPFVDNKPYFPSSYCGGSAGNSRFADVFVGKNKSRAIGLECARDAKSALRSG